MAPRVIGNALPEQTQNHEVPMLPINTGAAQLKDFAPQRFINREVKLPRAIISEARGRREPRLQPVRADNSI